MATLNASAEHYAKEAARLRNDETLKAAFRNVRAYALEALAKVKPTETDEIMRLQAIAGCLDEVWDLLDAFIKQTGAEDGGYVPNVRPE